MLDLFFSVLGGMIAIITAVELAVTKTEKVLQRVVNLIITNDFITDFNSITNIKINLI